MSTGEEHKSGALTAYICYAIGLFVPLVTIAGVIVNHIKRDEARGTWVESHHRWLMRTFWFSLLWSVVAAILTFVWVGWILFFGIAIWYIYRVVRGILAFNDQKPMYVSTQPVEEKLASEKAGG